MCATKVRKGKEMHAFGNYATLFNIEGNFTKSVKLSYKRLVVKRVEILKPRH